MRQPFLGAFLSSNTSCRGANSGVDPEHTNYRGSCLGSHSTFALLDEFHGHVAQLVIDPTPSQQRPPIVKIDLHRSPHGHPSGNRKALPYDGSPSALLMTQQHLAKK